MFGPWAADSEDIIGRSFSSSCTLTLPKASWQGSWENRENFSGFREIDGLQLSFSLQTVHGYSVSHIRKTRLVQNTTFLEVAVMNKVWMSSWPWTMGAQIWDPRENNSSPSDGKDDFTCCWAVLSEGESTRKEIQAGPIHPSPSLDNLGISAAIPQHRSQSYDNRRQDNWGGQQWKIFFTIIVF